MLKSCLILSLHIAVCRGDGSLILRFNVGMYHLQKWATGKGRAQVGQEAGTLPEFWFSSLPSGMLSPGLGARVHPCPSTNIGTLPPAGSKDAPPQTSGTSARPGISLNSIFPKSQNHGHLTAKATSRSP